MQVFLRAGLVCVNSYLYAVGGYNGQSQLSSVERYNLARNLWEPRASMHQCRSAHGIAVHQGRIYVFGKSVSHRKDAEIHSEMAAVASNGAGKTFTAPPGVDPFVRIEGSKSKSSFQTSACLQEVSTSRAS